MTGDKTKFEIDLEKFFPEIYQLNTMSKVDPKIWKTANAMRKMFNEGIYGEIKITYQKGRINHMFITMDVDSTNIT